MNASQNVDVPQQTAIEDASALAMAHRAPPALRGLELYSVVCLLIVLSAFGTAGNILVLWVFRKKKDRLVSTVLIIVLACVDLITCVVIIPYTVFMESVGFFIHNDVVCKIYQFLITSNIPFSALIMVTIAVDRYLCICHPFIRSVSTQKAKISVAGLGLLAAGIGFCVSLMYGVYCRHSTLGQNQLVTSEPLDQSIVFDVLYSTTPNFSEALLWSRSLVLCADGTCRKTVERIGTTPSGKEIEVHLRDSTRRTVYDGVCAPNDLLLSEDFQWYFQKFYNGLFLICLIIVITLYVLIYRSVMLRRRRRLREKRKSQSIVASLAKQRNGESMVMQEMVLTCETKDSLHVPMIRDLARDQSSNGSGARTGRRKSWSLDSNWIANLKTAAMLFVVTVVFIVTFLPAFMMTLRVVPYNAFIFYLYFANNVANPFIYSFMNKNFRDDLRRIFCLRASGTTSF